MYQYEAVIKVIDENGGFATLGYLYQHALKVQGCTWKTKTPYESIRRIVQNKDRFFKIKPGLYGLNNQKDEVLKKLSLQKSTPKQKKEEFSHTYYQGLITEIGNMQGYQTFVPAQDKNKTFLDQPLKNIVSLSKMLPFTYPSVLRKAQSVDVVWFNIRQFPTSFFEVEHTTNINNSLLKFLDLQDFYANFYIVSSQNRRKEYQQKIKNEAFKDIQKRVRFLEYNMLSAFHAKSHEIQKIREKISL
ncbi:MAG: hypothetical protein KAW47_05880 [Thermoplasmatales archaeon]|nr:hypothetical protein [Thermoplasmatales archaeon]